MRIARIVAAVVLTALLIAPAQAAKRVALVIGNDRYAALPQLRNAVADARLVAETLKSELQFQVFAGENLSYRATNRLHADFEAALAPGDTAFIFFTGHGVAFGAENYLLPIDTEKPRMGEENLVRSEAHAVDTLIRRIQARGAVASFFVIDACRDNPFEAVGVRSIGGSRGLARADVPTGVFVLFSAGIGQTALDRLNATDSSPNSVFTRTLVPLLRQPGITHLQLGKRVQTDVRALAASVSHQQQPAFYDQIDGEMVFKAAPEIATARVEPPVVTLPPAIAPATVTKLQERVTESATAPGVPIALHGAEAQKVVLYEEDPTDQQGKRFVGSATWRTETVSPVPGQEPELAIRADIEVPERKLAVTWTLRRNTDKRLPASHTVEIIFKLPADFPSGSISNVPGILMKSAEQTRGVPLAGAAVKVVNSYFMIGLSDADSDKERNIQLLKERGWFDLPVVYANNRRGIIAIEKGTPGERVFAEAFRVWKQ